MKKLLVLSVIATTLLISSGCFNNVNDPQDKTEISIEISTVSATNETVQESTALTEKLERDVITAFIALSEPKNIDLSRMSMYLVDNIQRVSPENVDIMLQVYEKAQMQALPEYQDAFLEESMQSILLTYSVENLRQNQVKEKAVRALLTEAAAVGYKIEAIEGTIAPYVDYGYFAQFASNATESTGAFYTLMKAESDHPSQKDAALIIPWEDVLQRGINFEAYLETYPNTYYEERARMHFEGYKNLALNGSANVPLFEYDTNAMNEEAKAAYTAFEAKQIQTAFADLIKNFVSLLKKHHYIKTVEVETFMNAQN